MAKTPAEPAPCDNEIFKNGKSLFLADTSMETCRAQTFEDYIAKIRGITGSRIDWHYSGGVAQVLYIGDAAVAAKLKKAVEENPCPARIMRWVEDGAGLYRKGVAPVPKGTIGGFMDPGTGKQVFMVNPE